MITQKLYEGISIGDNIIGLITYMRTDSVNIAKVAIDSVRKFILKEYTSDYLSDINRLFKTKDKNAQEAHECIRPTYVDKTPDLIKDYLSKDEYKLYDLIWRKFVSCQMKEAVFSQSIIKIVSGDTIWQVFGEIKKFDGYLKIYHFDDNKKDLVLPKFELKEKIFVLDIETEKHFTEPPSRYTEATLIKTMEKNGIGRPSTYAPIISNILFRRYIVIDDKKLKPEKIGFEVIEILEKFFPNIVDPKFTAEMEDSLDEIASGKEIWQEMLASFYGLFNDTLIKAKNTIPMKELQKVNRKCPECGEELVERRGRFGNFIGCSAYPKCKYIEKNNLDKDIVKDDNVVKNDLEKCPECGEELVERRGRFGSFIGCSAYPKCKYIKKQKVEKINKKCPNCGNELIVKFSKRGKFIGCSAYPKCKYIEKYK